MLQFIGLQRVEHDLAIEQKQEEHICHSCEGQILFGELYKKKIQATRQDTNNIGMSFFHLSNLT